MRFMVTPHRRSSLIGQAVAPRNSSAGELLRVVLSQ